MPTIAVITNYFPALTETFINNEINGLKKRNISIKTFSIRKPQIDSISKESHNLFYSTIYLLPINIINFLKAHCYFIFRHPLRYMRLLIFLMTRNYSDNRLHKKNRLRTFFHFCEGVYLAKLIKDDSNIKHIHAHYANHSTTLAMVVSELTKIPFSFTAHAYDIWADNLFLKEKVNAAKFVITCAKYGKEVILKNHNIINPDKITTIYHGVNIEKFKMKERENQNKKENRKINILTIGRLVVEKAQKNLILACKTLKEEGYDFQCNIIGDGPLFKDLQEVIFKNKLDKVVSLVGKVFQEEIVKYYQNADIVVLPSIRIKINGTEIDSDNLPNVLLESLSMGIPSIASNIAAIPELIKHKETGILVQPDDVGAIADAIKLLIKDKKLANNIAENGRTFICENFDVEKSLDQIVKLYHSNGVIENTRFLN